MNNASKTINAYEGLQDLILNQTNDGDNSWSGQLVTLSYTIGIICL